MPPRLLDLLAPPRCLLCTRRLPATRPLGLCPACGAEIDRARPVPLRADGIDSGQAALPYAGAGRRLVGALKFSRLLVAAELGAGLISSRADWGQRPGTVVAVPGAPLRRAHRGFDPAAELAAALARSHGLDLATPLRRTDLRRQRGRARAERISRPPRIRAAGEAPLDVLLVDDVVTTGATLTACAVALRGAGCRSITAAALAAAPPPRGGAGGVG